MFLSNLYLMSDSTFSPNLFYPRAIILIHDCDHPSFVAAFGTSIKHNKVLSPCQTIPHSHMSHTHTHTNNAILCTFTPFITHNTHHRPINLLSLPIPTILSSLLNPYSPPPYFIFLALVGWKAALPLLAFLSSLASVSSLSSLIILFRVWTVPAPVCSTFCRSSAIYFERRLLDNVHCLGVGLVK